MNNLRTCQTKSTACSILHCGYAYFFLLLLPCLGWGIYAANRFLNDRNIETIYTKTTCHLLNYTVFPRDCVRCTSTHHCTTGPCFDEQISMTYPIRNETFVSSKVTILNQLKTSEQSKVITKSNTFLEKLQSGKNVSFQIGNNYTCFYQTSNVTSIILNLPDLKTPLIVIWICATLIIIPFLIVFFALCYIVGEKLINHGIGFVQHGNVNHRYSCVDVDNTV